MSRHLKPILYGDFTATVVAINIVTVLILFGSDNVVIKYLPGYLKSKDIKLISAFKYWNYKLIKKTFSICIIAFIALYLLLFIFSIHNIDITLSRHCSILVLCIAPFSALSVLLSNYILSGRLVSLFYLFNNLAMPFFLLLIFSSSALIFHFDMDYPYMIIFIFASYCVVIVVKLLIVMKIFKKVFWLIAAFTLFASTGFSEDYYQIDKPGIKKFGISVASATDSSGNKAFTEQLETMLEQSLLFKIVDKKDADFIFNMSASIEEKAIWFTLEGAKSKIVTERTFGVKLKNTDAEYLKFRTAQVANKVIQELFKIKGALGSTIVYSRTEDNRKMLYMNQVAVQSNPARVTYNQYSNSNVS